MLRHYSPQLWEHFQNPRHAGYLTDPTGTGMVRYPTCGDVSRVFVRVENGVVIAASFQGTGCGPIIACGSVLMGMLIGRTVADAAAITPEDVARPIRLPKPKMHCAEVTVQALRAALQDSQAREGGDVR